MEEKLIKYLESLRPTLDVHGRWAMFATAKTASVSMGRGPLKQTMIVFHRGHKNWAIVWNNLFVPRIDDVFTFSFVRNPWERVLSAFNYMQNHTKLHWDMVTDITFKDFIKTTFLKEGPEINSHFFTQGKNILFNGKPFLSFIGKFENMDKDWKIVADIIGVKNTLPKLNARAHRHYSNYYDDDAIEIVRNTYKEEIDFLGYEYENRKE